MICSFYVFSILVDIVINLCVPCGFLWFLLSQDVMHYWNIATIWVMVGCMECIHEQMRVALCFLDFSYALVSISLLVTRKGNTYSFLLRLTTRGWFVLFYFVFILTAVGFCFLGSKIPSSYFTDCGVSFLSYFYLDILTLQYFEFVVAVCVLLCGFSYSL